MTIPSQGLVLAGVSSHLVQQPPQLQVLVPPFLRLSANKVLYCTTALYSRTRNGRPTQQYIAVNCFHLVAKLKVQGTPG